MMQREKKRELWLVFTLNGKEIASYTVRGTSNTMWLIQSRRKGASR